MGRLGLCTWLLINGDVNMSVSFHSSIMQHTNWSEAIKEFSKSRLRRRARSNFLRRPREGRRPGHLNAPGSASPMYLGSPMHTGLDPGDEETPEGSLHLIQEEIAVMKKLHHQNLVSLVEALDDPEEDSLYMVLELCEKGVVMKVGIGEVVAPHEAEVCRCWFRDLILGVEYCEWRISSSQCSLTPYSACARDCSP